MKNFKFTKRYTFGKKVADLPFMGETMVCESCYKRQKSDPNIESGWTAVTVEGKRIYICPNCWGNAESAIINKL